jgi:hypothetical protein
MKLKALIGHNAISPIPGQRDYLCDLSGSFLMKEIQLTKSQVALVDDDDFEYLNHWKWHASMNGNTYYVMRKGRIGKGKKNRKNVIMHRIIMNAPYEMEIDHINHNGLDNRKENLRVCTRRENSMNLTKPNKTGFVGVGTSGNKFTAQIVINKRKTHIGTFLTAIDAHNHYMLIVNKIKEQRP